MEKRAKERTSECGGKRWWPWRRSRRRVREEKGDVAMEEKDREGRTPAAANSGVGFARQLLLMGDRLGLNYLGASA